MADPFIVAEVSKNWINGTEVAPTGPPCQQFERVININAGRGYRLGNCILDSLSD